MIVAALFVAGVGCGGSGGGDGPTATIARPKSTTTTAAMTAEARVEAAYLRSWKVYAKAVRTLDASGLDQIYAERALVLVRADVDRLRAANTPVRCAVDHNYTVDIGGPALATVRDKYVNHCVLLDPKTGKPSEPDPNKVLSETYILRLIEGQWKIVGIQRSA